MFVTNWISTTKIQKISEITNFFRHYFLSRTEVWTRLKVEMFFKFSSIFNSPIQSIDFFIIMFINVVLVP